jgi:predicted PurR-regulated permease PerM
VLTRDRLLSWILLLGTAIFLALSVGIVLPFVPGLTWAVVFAILGRRMHVWMERHIANRNFAALLSVIVVAIVIIGPFVWISIQVSLEIRDGIKQIESGVKSGAWQAEWRHHPKLVHAYQWLDERVDLAGVGAQIAKFVQAQIARLVGKTIETLIQGFISLFALFFFFRDRREMLQAIRFRLPFSESEIRLLLTRIRNMVRATIFGRFLTSLVQGGLGGVMFWILGIDAALVWGVVMAVLSVIPAVGSVFIWAPAAAWLAISGHWVKAIILAVWGSAVVGTIDNILYPLFVGRDVKIHTLLLFFALLGGVLLFGGTGLVLGPVIMETSLSLLEILRERTRAGRPVEQIT